MAQESSDGSSWALLRGGFVLCPPKKCNHLVWDVRLTPHVGVRFGKAGVGRTFKSVLGRSKLMPGWGLTCLFGRVSGVSVSTRRQGAWSTWVVGRGQPRRTAPYALQFRALGYAGAVSRASPPWSGGVPQQYDCGGSSSQRIHQLHLRLLCLLSLSTALVALFRGSAEWPTSARGHTMCSAPPSPLGGPANVSVLSSRCGDWTSQEARCCCATCRLLRTACVRI